MQSIKYKICKNQEDPTGQWKTKGYVSLGTGAQGLSIHTQFLVHSKLPQYTEHDNAPHPPNYSGHCHVVM